MVVVLDILNGDDDSAEYTSNQRTPQEEAERTDRNVLRDPKRILRKQVINIHGEIVDV